MIQIEKLAERIFSLLKGNGFQIKIFDEDGNETTNPQYGRRFFVTEPNFMITIDEDSNNVEFNKGASVDFEKSAELQDHIKRIADSFLVNSSIKVFGKSIQPRDFSYKAKMMKENKINSIAESSLSKMSGSKKTSKQTLENVNIIVKHKKPVNEETRGSRSRSISAIFLETNGERFRFPVNNLSGARAMAQHMVHGGTLSDKVGSHIVENTEWLMKLQNFNRYVTSNNLINEDSSNIIEIIKENIETIKTELKKLTGSKTYESVSARINSFERETLSEDDTSQLKELFTIKRFDEKFNEVLPIVKQLVYEKDTYYKRIEEAAANTVMLRKESINVSPIFEFASKNAAFGYKLNELSLRIVENDELAGFINKVGTKLCKEGIINDFERAIVNSVLENSSVMVMKNIKEINESIDLAVYFDRFDFNFI